MERAGEFPMEPGGCEIITRSPKAKEWRGRGISVSVVPCQGQGLGRLDAYDADAGAGSFYAKCGYQERERVIYRGTPLVYFELLI